MYFSLRPKKVVFMHIPKTAGTTLYHVLAKNYNPKKQHRVYEQPNLELAAKEAIQVKKYNFIYGHFHFVDELIDSPFYTLSWLREPVACVISSYLHLTYSDLPFHKKEMQGINSFGDYLKKFDPKNNQSKRFSGFTQWKFASNKEEVHERALENFNHFDFVGITERFEESLLCLSTEISLNRLSFKRQNVQKRVFEFQEIREKYLDDILAINENDFLLYQKANEALDNRLLNITSKEKQLYKLRKLV